MHCSYSAKIWSRVYAHSEGLHFGTFFLISLSFLLRVLRSAIVLFFLARLDILCGQIHTSLLVWYLQLVSKAYKYLVWDLWTSYPFCQDTAIISRISHCLLNFVECKLLLVLLSDRDAFQAKSSIGHHANLINFRQMHTFTTISGQYNMIRICTWHKCIIKYSVKFLYKHDLWNICTITSQSSVGVLIHVICNLPWRRRRCISV